MTIGTLRDQVIYPHTHEEQLKRGVSDEELQDYLNKACIYTLMYAVSCVCMFQ